MLRGRMVAWRHGDSRFAMYEERSIERIVAVEHDVLERVLGECCELVSMTEAVRKRDLLNQ
ncbi:MAG: hypothetical protein R3C02_16920 [Planctomycetaceae bacterium]